MSHKPVLIPLYNGETFQLTATGTLVVYGERHFLCTASHALPKTRPGSHSLIAGGLTPFALDEFRYNITAPGFKRYDHIVDLAVTELSCDQLSRCESNSFIKIDIDTPWKPAFSRRQLLASGFPFERNQEMKDGKITSNGLHVPLKPTDKSLIHDQTRKEFKAGFICGICDPRHYLRPKEFRGYRAYEGMSGGPMFYEDFGNLGQFVELAGILVFAQSDKRAAVTFTAIRTRLVAQLIHYFFPDTPPVASEYLGASRRSVII